jgi:hypothetical protein
MMRLKREDYLGTVLLLVWFVAVFLVIRWATNRAVTAAEPKTQTHCADPVYLDAVGHADSTGWIYGCADGSMVELPSPLPSAPVGNASAWGQR